MGPNWQFPADLVLSTEEILNGKFHFLCSVFFNIIFFVVFANNKRKLLPAKNQNLERDLLKHQSLNHQF